MTDMTADLEAIKALHEGWVRANSDADDEWLRENVHPGLVMWNTVGSNFFGRDALIELWKTLRQIVADAGRGPGLSEAWDEGYIIEGDLAVVHCMSRLAVDFGSDAGAEAGGALDQVYRCTEVYRRENGRWLMVHYHGSPHTPGLLGGS
ncbi:YybH family protein [Phytoactinopolyspora limicola]|uniref:YybH family protein n=1 Tax=Phytoactinopolyspora limicola TaxID=2715536 RepID=UPI00140BA368|nr:nuclear transport factor 2 family protein [Phytoactinopolyspora limicola]